MGSFEGLDVLAEPCGLGGVIRKQGEGVTPAFEGAAVISLLFELLGFAQETGGCCFFFGHTGLVTEDLSYQTNRCWK
jgi:hypothetical protein